jgi:hypothetical protein
MEKSRISETMNSQTFRSVFSRVDTKLLLGVLAGFCGFLLATKVYCPLDKTLFLFIELVLMLLAVVPISAMEKRVKLGIDVQSFFPVTFFLACGPAFLGVIVFANGVLDRSPVENHSQVVTRKWISNYQGTRYVVEFTSLRPNGSSQRINVPYQTYSNIEVGNPITLELRKGAFHIVWIEAVYVGRGSNNSASRLGPKFSLK